MKVYEISTLAKPARGNFPHYAGLTMQIKDRQALGADVFSGQPYPRKWRPIEVYVEKPKRPRPNFYCLGTGIFVCDERIRDLVGEALVDAGEFLPITIEGESGQFFIYNVTNCINVFDREKSIWRYYGPEDKLKMLVTPAFIAERFGEENVFKFPDAGAGEIYCLERTGDPADGEFKALVERHSLTGLEFKLVWSDEKT